MTNVVKILLKTPVGLAFLLNSEIFLSHTNGERRNFLANVIELRNFRDKGNRRALAMRVSLFALAEGCKKFIEPSPEFVILTIVRKRLRPLTVREGVTT